MNGKRSKALKEPFLHTIKLDLFRIYEHTVANRVKVHLKAVQQQLSSYPQPIQAGDVRYQSLIDESRRLNLPFRTTRDVMDDGRLDDMSSITAELISGTPLPEQEKNTLEKVREEVIRLAEECDETGNITPAAEAYLVRYSRDVDARANELFG